jgi:hypothetical protein
MTQAHRRSVSAWPKMRCHSHAVVGVDELLHELIPGQGSVHAIE